MAYLAVSDLTFTYHGAAAPSPTESEHPERAGIISKSKAPHVFDEFLRRSIYILIYLYERNCIE